MCSTVYAVLYNDFTNAPSLNHLSSTLVWPSLIFLLISLHSWLMWFSLAQALINNNWIITCLSVGVLALVVCSVHSIPAIFNYCFFLYNTLQVQRSTVGLLSTGSLNRRCLSITLLRSLSGTARLVDMKQWLTKLINSNFYSLVFILLLSWTGKQSRLPAAPTVWRLANGGLATCTCVCVWEKPLPH